MHRLYIIVIFIFICFSSVAQEQLKHAKRIYKADNGKLYINKELPLYLRIAVSVDPDSETYLLESEATKQFTNPMYLDTEGLNTFRSPSAVDTTTKKTVYPLSDVIFEVYADSKPPRTKLSYGNTSKHYVNSRWYLGKELQLNLNSRDALSGIDKIYYSIDKEEFKEYTGNLNITEERDYFIQYYAVDNVGNAEKVKSSTFVFDTSAPKTEYMIHGNYKDNILSKRSTISLNSSDNLSGVSLIYYSLDGDSKKIYNGRIYVSYLREGEHTLTYYAIDKVKNKEVEKTYSFFVDKTPPIIVDEVLGDQFFINGKAYSSGRTKLKITAVDNKAGVKAIYYSIDEGEKQLYEKPFYLPTKSGNVSIKTYAVDNVNNSTGSTSISQNQIYARYIDLTGPELSYRYRGRTFSINDTVYVGQHTRVKLKAIDRESGMKKITYTIDEDSTLVFDKPFGFEKEGFHEVSFLGYDNVNNTNIGRLYVIADLQGPHIMPTFSINSCGQKNGEPGQMPVFYKHMVLFIAAKDEMTGYDKMYYSINNQKEIPFHGEIRGFKSGQDYKIKIRAVDKLGNENESIVFFSIE